MDNHHTFPSSNTMQDVHFEHYTYPLETIFEEQEDVRSKTARSHAANLGAGMMATAIVLWIYIMLFVYRSWGRPVYPPDVPGPSLDI